MLRMRQVLFAVMFSAPLLAQGLAPDVLLLARIKSHMQETLTRLPNYTCTETVERSHRRNPNRRFELQDVLRLEVAFVDGKEMYAWPGSTKFDERPLEDFANSGTIANGSFALHAKTVFLSRAPRITYEGLATEGNRQLHHFRFDVSQFMSGFHMRSSYGEAIVPYYGSFWIDSATLDLIRLQVITDRIPPQLRIARSEDTMEYARVRIGESDFLLPQSSDLQMTNSVGEQSRNRTRFTRCHQFSGESTLIFDDPPPEKAAPAPAPVSMRDVRLPAGVGLTLKLDEDLRMDQLATGDPITAVLSRPVRLNKQELLPKGAFVLGRVVEFSKHNGRSDYYTVGLQFHAIRFENGRADFHGRFQSLASVMGVQARSPYSWPAQPPRWLVGEPSLREPEKPDTVTLFVPAERPLLPRGLELYWRTPPEEKP